MKKLKQALITVFILAAVISLFVIAARATVFYNAEEPVTTQESNEAFELLYETLEDSRFTYFEYLDS
ncbi:MAG: hypothetical protein JXN10_08175, partial [Clostridia bacterium]|nr:hypothetical protein [Clostridia bacterium]